MRAADVSWLKRAASTRPSLDARRDGRAYGSPQQFTDECLDAHGPMLVAGMVHRLSRRDRGVDHRRMNRQEPRLLPSVHDCGQEPGIGRRCRCSANVRSPSVDPRKFARHITNASRRPSTSRQSESLRRISEARARSAGACLGLHVRWPAPADMPSFCRSSSPLKPLAGES